jgi:PAS domain S-box-containing protein
VRLGFALVGAGISFHAIVGFGARERAAELGADLSIVSVFTPEQEAAAIQQFVARQVDVLIVDALESEIVLPALLETAAAGIPMIAADGSIHGVEAACSVHSANVRGGELAAAFLVEQLQGRGTIALLQGLLTSDNGLDRSRGFHHIVDTYPEIRIAEADAEWTRESGAVAMRGLLVDHPVIDAVFAHNDAQALGALDALEEAGRAGDVVIVGFDAMPEALTAIARGTIAATVRQMPREMGRLAIELALRVHAGQEVPPVVETDVKLVTPANVAEASLETLPLFPPILRDLAEQSAALAEERTLLRTLIDNLPDLVYVKDRDSRFLLVNEAAAEYIGARTPDDAVGKSDFDFFPHAYASQFRADEEAILASGRPLINHEERAPAATGDTHWFSTTKVLTYNENGQVAGLVGMSRDITRQKESEAHRMRLMEEQTALRRVATLAARESSALEVLEAVAEEAARVLEVDAIGMIRFEPDQTAILVAQSDTPWDPPPLGTSFTLDGENVVTRVHRTGQVARVDDWENATGSVSALATHLGVTSTVASPIVVEGRLWGTMVAATNRVNPLPTDTESQIVEFAKLLATAISNAESRESLAQLADEQAALGRVATLVAAGIEPDELFSAVSEEVARLFGADSASVGRFGPNGSEVVAVGRSAGLRGIPIGTHADVDKSATLTEVHRTGRAARWSDGFYTSLAAPIMVGGSLWGVLQAGSGRVGFPPDTEERLEKFGELVATAIANAESRAALAASEARARELANVQAALRRVATLVAQGASPDKVFSAVASEVAGIIDIPVVAVNRYEADGTFTILGVAGDTHFTVGSRWPAEETGIAGMILATGQPSRWDDYSTMPGRLGDAVRQDLLGSTVGVPILVEGFIWGFMVAATHPGKPIPVDTEAQLARFTELVATAVSNASTRTELVTSRARLVSAADETRRRLERDLHDGIQQWLVALALRARKAAKLSAAGESIVQELSGLADDLVAVTDELREISRGIHPAVLSDSGLDAALAALVRRSAIRVDLDVRFQRRYGPTLEATVYYVVAESITNAAKHAQASTVAVRGGLRGESVELEIKDDGVGGAEPGRGTGLVGLKDRIDTLGGTISLTSPVGVGTTIRVWLPASPVVEGLPPSPRTHEAVSARTSG